MLHLLTLIWVFNATQPALSTFSETMSQAEFAAPGVSNSFTVKFTAALGPVETAKSILEIPNVLNVGVRPHNPLDRNRQNYPAFKMADGSVPVLEATLTLHSVEHPDWTNMTIGVPVARLKQPEGEHEVVLNFTGVRWTMYVDGELMDNDFPFGYPRWEPTNAWKRDPAWVKKAELFAPGIEPKKVPAPAGQVAREVQYWTPPGHNTWVGDVATLFYGGRYHVFYLFDRRHHQSKFGCGAHYFEHLSTADFKTWTEHEAATPLEEQWECIGTGTPFEFEHRLCLSYGLHTTRVYPPERTVLPAQWEYLKQHGRTGSFRMESTPGFPAGSTYAVSQDGLGNFRKTRILFHPCENPSVYRDPAGNLRMMANYRSSGMWESGTVDGDWRCLNPDFPPGGDCTFFFRWGKFDYIIGGFKNLWSKPASAPDTAYADEVKAGRDFYDGLSVPSIAEVKGGRFLMAGWIPMRGWGGALVIRELVQFPDGRIGSKWLKEITPETERARAMALHAGEVVEVPGGANSFLLTFKVQPGTGLKGKLGVLLLPAEGDGRACELQIGVGDRRAQWADGTQERFAAREKSLREGGSANAIENLEGIDRAFTVRVMVKGDEKLGGSLVDAEIAGQRTLISYRADLTVRKIMLRAEGAQVPKVEIAGLKR